MTVIIIISWTAAAFAAGVLLATKAVPWVEYKLSDECVKIGGILERQLKKFQISDFKFQILNLKFEILTGATCMAVLSFIIIPSWTLKFLAVLPSAWIGWHFPRWFWSYLLKRRVKKFEEQFVDGLTLVANAVKSSLSLHQAFEMASFEMPKPFGEEFAHLLAEVRMGAAIEDGLHSMESRFGLDDLKMVVQSICILRETGGNIIETFQTVTATIRERQKVHGKIRVLTTQGIVQGAIIFCMPFALALALYLMAPDFIMPLFTKPLGWILIFMALALQTIGAVLMKKIVVIKV